MNTGRIPIAVSAFALLLILPAFPPGSSAQEQGFRLGTPGGAPSLGSPANNLAPQQAPAPVQPAAPQGGARGGGRTSSALSDPWVGKKKLLVWADVQTGYHHPAISHAMAVIERLGRESGAYVTMIRTDSQVITKKPIIGTGSRYQGREINAHNLDYYDAIFFLGAGEGTLTDQQKRDLLSFVHDDGKGFVAGHASLVGFYNWPDFLDMLGATMKGEFPIDPTAILVDDAKFPGIDAFPRSFTFSDQFSYPGPPYEKGKVHTIMRLDASKLTPEQTQRAGVPGGDFPIVWARVYGKGRVYYSSFGHPEETWDDPQVEQMYLGAIKWALGLVDADVKPDQATSVSSKP